MLKKVFCKENREEPIAYGEFAAIGMSEADYLSYVERCDFLRSAVILHFFVDGAPSLYSPNELRNRRTVTSLEKIGKSCLDEIVKGLQPFCSDDVDLLYLERKEIPFKYLVTGARYYGESRIVDGQWTSPPVTILHKGFDDFRVYFEQILYRLINRILPVVSFEIEPELKDMQLDELERIAERRRSQKPYFSRPNLPQESGKSADIYFWADKAEGYELYQSFIENYSDLEKVIESKKAAIFDARKNTLYIYRGNLSCKLKQHELEETTAVIELHESSGEKAIINMSYCHECNKFFIEEQSYLVYRRKYGFLPVYVEYFGDEKSPSNYYKRVDKSPLMLCGYSVSKKDGLSDEQRHQLLSLIMDHNINGLGKSVIKSHLEMLIKTNGHKPSNIEAKEKWKNDLQFVNDYEIDKQRTVPIQKIEQKRR